MRLKIRQRTDGSGARTAPSVHRTSVCAVKMNSRGDIPRTPGIRDSLCSIPLRDCKLGSFYNS